MYDEVVLHKKLLIKVERGILIYYILILLVRTTINLIADPTTAKMPNTTLNTLVRNQNKQLSFCLL